MVIGHAKVYFIYGYCLFIFSKIAFFKNVDVFTSRSAKNDPVPVFSVHVGVLAVLLRARAPPPRPPEPLGTRPHHPHQRHRRWHLKQVKNIEKFTKKKLERRTYLKFKF